MIFLKKFKDILARILRKRRKKKGREGKRSLFCPAVLFCPVLS